MIYLAIFGPTIGILIGYHVQRVRSERRDRLWLEALNQGPWDTTAPTVAEIHL